MTLAIFVDRSTARLFSKKLIPAYIGFFFFLSNSAYSIIKVRIMRLLINTSAVFF